MSLQTKFQNLFGIIRKNVLRHKSTLFLIVIYLVALGVRMSTWEIVSGDMNNALLPWYRYIAENGRFQSFSNNFYNYTPSYLYLISIMTSFRSIPPILAIKLISIFFDFIAAYLIFKIVKLKYPQGSIPHIASAVFLFAPTVFFNSAIWGQCDIIYTTGILAVVYFCLVKKDFLAIIAFGIAISFKLQTVFIAPFLLILLVKGRVRWWLIFLVPAIYLLSLLPAWAAGRPLKDLFLIYLDQANFYHSISANAPNIYQWLDNQYYSSFVNMGMLLTLGLIILGIFAFNESKIRINRDVIIILSTLSVLIIPFFLPKMHDRYFFPADVISIVYAFYFPKYFYFPIVIGLTSFMTYIRFLFGISFINPAFLPFGILVIILLILHHLGKIYRINDTMTLSN